jgi:hypothetical protein
LLRFAVAAEQAGGQAEPQCLLFLAERVAGSVPAP